MNKIKTYKLFEGSEKLDSQDLVYLFAELIDEYHMIAFQTGEYFKSNPKFITKLEDKDLDYLDRKKPFQILISLNKEDKLNDSVKILKYIESIKNQIEYFGYTLEDFKITKNESGNWGNINYIELNYIKK